MWILDKPLIEDAISDIAQIFAEGGRIINEIDRAILISIYRRYDRNNGRMKKEWDAELNLEKREQLYNAYGETYEGKRLFLIRKALMKMVTICPMCGIQPPSQLDHHSPRSDYKSLSVFRLNLVPVCGVCNNKKKDKDPSLFIHPYYDHCLKDIPFFLISIHSSPKTHRMSWKFTINRAVIGDADLANKIDTQINVIKLYRRLYRETNEMLSDMLSGIDILSEDSLNKTLQQEYRKHKKRKGTNDWHTVFVKALIDSPHFSVAEAKAYSDTIMPVNGGINA